MHPTVMLSEEVFSIKVVEWPASAAGRLTGRIALFGIATVEAELEVLGSHVAFPFIFRREAAGTAVVGEGADERAAVSVVGARAPPRDVLCLASGRVDLPL